MKVWIIESGEYEQRSVDGVAVSLEAAVSFVKTRYGANIVKWDDAARQEYPGTDLVIYELNGHSDVGYSLDFSIQEYELSGAS